MAKKSLGCIYVAGYYELYKNICRRLIERSTKIDIDKEALLEAQRLQFPNKDLLLARILFDGGYYNECFRCIEFYRYSRNIG